MDRSQPVVLEARRALRSRRPRAAASPASAPRPSLRARAYEEIQRRINTLAFKPGSVLNEAQLAQLLGIGRMPVREALSQLDVEGLVEIIPRKGVMIRPVSLNEVLEIAGPFITS